MAAAKMQIAHAAKMKEAQDKLQTAQEIVQDAQANLQDAQANLQAAREYYDVTWGALDAGALKRDQECAEWWETETKREPWLAGPAAAAVPAAAMLQFIATVKVCISESHDSGFCSEADYQEHAPNTWNCWFLVKMTAEEVELFLSIEERKTLEKHHSQEVDERSMMLEEFEVVGCECGTAHYEISRVMIGKVDPSAMTGKEESFPDSDDFVAEQPGLNADYFPSFTALQKRCLSMIGDPCGGITTVAASHQRMMKRMMG